MDTNWTEWHLTPDGWIPGVTRLVAGGTKGSADQPVDRLLTCVFEEFQENLPGSVKSFVTERWRSDSQAQVDAMLKKFGECPRELYIYPEQPFSMNKCIRVPKVFK